MQKCYVEASESIAFRGNAMPVVDADTKTQRLLELQMLFWRNPGRSLRTSEIATHLGVTERTIRNYLDELSGSGKLPTLGRGQGSERAYGGGGGAGLGSSASGTQGRAGSPPPK